MTASDDYLCANLRRRAHRWFWGPFDRDLRPTLQPTHLFGAQTEIFGEAVNRLRDAFIEPTDSGADPYTEFREWFGHEVGPTNEDLSRATRMLRFLDLVLRRKRTPSAFSPLAATAIRRAHNGLFGEDERKAAVVTIVADRLDRGILIPHLLFVMQLSAFDHRFDQLRDCELETRRLLVGGMECVDEVVLRSEAAPPSDIYDETAPGKRRKPEANGVAAQLCLMTGAFDAAVRRKEKPAKANS